jgi:hypothetical protein
MKFKRVILFPFIFPMYMILLWIKSRRAMIAESAKLLPAPEPDTLYVNGRKICSMPKGDYSDDPLRQLKLLQPMSGLVRDHGLTPFVFHLFDNGDSEEVGDTISGMLLSREPTTLEIGPGGEKHPGVKLTWELTDGCELVEQVCFSKLQVGQAKKLKLDRRYTLTTAKRRMKNGYDFSVIKYTKDGGKWGHVPIAKLGNAHLWNIWHAMERGSWANGTECFVDEDQANNIYDEYKKREKRGLFNTKAIKIANEAHDARQDS